MLTLYWGLWDSHINATHACELQGKALVLGMSRTLGSGLLFQISDRWLNEP